MFRFTHQARENRASVLLVSLLKALRGERFDRCHFVVQQISAWQGAISYLHAH